MIKRISLRLFFAVLGLLAITLLCMAQSETGQVAGAVVDPSGAPVANASVKLRSSGTNSERTLTTTTNGDFVIANLIPGEYVLTVEDSGFATFKQKLIVNVGAKVGVDVKLQIGQSTTVVEVTEAAVQVNTQTQTLSTTVSQTELRELPTLTRNPYALVALSGNASDAGAGGRGVGFAINGQRESSTNVLLDGAANNDEFSAGVGQQVPLDSVQEFSVLTNNFTAEFGRATGGVVNVITKSGGNSFHGTAYEFNRVSALSSNSFDNNANAIPKSIFTRNQFGYSAGGPAVKNKLFFFSSTEWLRIRSPAQETAVVPTSQFLALTAPGVQAFFANAKLKTSDAVLQTYTGSNTSLCGKSTACASFVAANPTLPIFQKISYVANADAGGGIPTNQYENVDRVDYNLSDRTQIYARYALQGDSQLAGSASSSPYQGYDTGQTDFDNNILVSVVHTFIPSLVSQSKANFNRLNELQPFGPAGGQVPTLFTGTTGAALINNSSILFPGYNPATPGSSIPFGGPQNFVQIYQDFTWNKGKHSFRFGGSFDYQRDNRSFGAYEDGAYYMASGAGSSGQSIAAMLSGVAYEFQAAIYPQGKFPGDTVSLPLTSPNFSRSNRYNEGAVYAQDAWKISPTLTANIGLRWEHFGVQHNKNPLLDSNFYDPSNQIDTPLGIRLGQAALVPKSTQGSAWKPDYHDFAPRLGFAWDVFGNGKTSIRGGYGIGYERNFGNVTFNMIQNPPNYETVQILSSSFGNIPVSPANFGPLAGTSGTVKLPKASLRNVDYNIKTAYSHLWSTSIEHEFSKSLVAGVDYTGSRGVHLYDIAILNQPGFGNVFLGDPCSAAAGDCTSYLNNQYSGINRRGSHGWSNLQRTQLSRQTRRYRTDRSYYDRRLHLVACARQSEQHLLRCRRLFQ